MDVWRAPCILLRLFLSSIIMLIILHSLGLSGCVVSACTFSTRFILVTKINVGKYSFGVFHLYSAGKAKPAGGGGILADQIAISQPCHWEHIMPTTLLLSTSDFQTIHHPCSIVKNWASFTWKIYFENSNIMISKNVCFLVEKELFVKCAGWNSSAIIWLLSVHFQLQIE